MGYFDSLIKAQGPESSWFVLGSGEKSLSEKLNDIDEAYKNQLTAPQFDLPDNLGLSEIDYVAMSDEEIKAVAESSLAEFKSASANQIQGAYSDSVKALEAEKASGAAALAAKTAAAEKAYEQAKESASNEVLKRGLGRSSIAVGTISAYDKGLADEKVALNNAYEDGILAIGNKISELEVERNNALRDLDITYAAKLAIKISDLETQRDEKIAEAVKYNNSVREKENEYALEKLKTIAQMTGENYDNLVKQYEAYQKAQEMMMQEKYKLFLDKLSSMTRSEALKALENDPIYRNHLDASTLNMLRLEVMARAK